LFSYKNNVYLKINNLLTLKHLAMKKSILFVIAFSLLYLFSNAQVSGWKHFYKGNSAIPFTKIDKMQIATDGKVWMSNDLTGAYGHLLSFDATTFTPYLTSGWINDITIAPDGKIWLTSSIKELKSWNGSSWMILTPSLISSAWAKPIHADKNGKIWIVNDGYLISYDGSSWTQFTTSTGLPSGNINCLYSNATQLLIGTNDAGLIFFDGTSTWTVKDTTNSNIPSNKIMAMMQRNDTLWIGCGGGNLVAYHNSTFTIYTNAYINDNIYQLDIDSKGNVWIAAYGTGVVKFDGTNWTLFDNTNYPLDFYNQIMSIGVDASDNVWIGNRQDGLTVCNENGWAKVEENIIPKSFSLSQNYPNPFETQTTINYTIPENSFVSLVVYNILGKKILTLVNETQNKGKHQIVFDAEKLSDGIYYYELKCNSFVKARKMIKNVEN